jgi:hypothetical protein
MFLMKVGRSGLLEDRAHALSVRNHSLGLDEQIGRPMQCYGRQWVLFGASTSPTGQQPPLPDIMSISRIIGIPACGDSRIPLAPTMQHLGFQGSQSS